MSIYLGHGCCVAEELLRYVLIVNLMEVALIHSEVIRTHVELIRLSLWEIHRRDPDRLSLSLLLVGWWLFQLKVHDGLVQLPK